MIPDDMEIRELAPEETTEMLALRNSIFTPITPEHFRAMNCTAAVAKRAGEFYGAIPLQFRELVLRPGVSAPVVFENAVGVSDKSRGMGLGSALIECAAEKLADRVDALCVYRGGERTDGYRFYRKTGHGDLAHIAPLRLKNPQAKKSGAQRRPFAECLGLEDGMGKLFSRNYRNCGGGWKRGEGWLKARQEAHVYRNDDWLCFTLGDGKKLSGYAIVNPNSKHLPGQTICDFAANGEASARAVLAAVEADAAKQGKEVTIISGRHFRWQKLFLARGYTADNSTPFVMARVLKPENLFAKLAAGSPLLKNLKLTAVTPHRDAVLNSPEKPKLEASLFLKEAYLSRLLFSRLDLKQALAQDLVRLSPVPENTEKELGKIFRFTPWHVCGLDYV